MILALEIILALIIAAIVVVTVYIYTQETEKVVFYLDKRSKAELVSETPEKICFNIELPYNNLGQDEGVFLDVYLRPYLCQEQYDGALLRGKINLKGKFRDDDYFECMLVPVGQANSLVMRMELTPLKAANAREALLGMPEVDVAVFAEMRGRGPLYRQKLLVTITPEELQAMLK
jgi:hypothetical protein